MLLSLFFSFPLFLHLPFIFLLPSLLPFLSKSPLLFFCVCLVFPFVIFVLLPFFFFPYLFLVSCLNFTPCFLLYCVTLPLCPPSAPLSLSFSFSLYFYLVVLSFLSLSFYLILFLSVLAIQMQHLDNLFFLTLSVDLPLSLTPNSPHVPLVSLSSLCVQNVLRACSVLLSSGSAELWRSQSSAQSGAASLADLLEQYSRNLAQNTKHTYLNPVALVAPNIGQSQTHTPYTFSKQLILILVV